MIRKILIDSKNPQWSRSSLSKEDFDKIIAEYPFKVRTTFSSSDVASPNDFTMAKRWIKRNTSGGNFYSPIEVTDINDAAFTVREYYILYFFKEEEDAVLFKITWG